MRYERISGEGFLRFSGSGRGSFGRRRNLRVITGFTSIESEEEKKKNHMLIIFATFKC